MNQVYIKKEEWEGRRLVEKRSYLPLRLKRGSNRRSVGVGSKVKDRNF